MIDLHQSVSPDQHDVLAVLVLLDYLEAAGVPTRPLVDVLRQRRDHIALHGHTPAQDATRTVRSMAIATRDYAMDALEHLHGHPSPQEQTKARAKMLKSVALGLATLARMDMETST